MSVITCSRFLEFDAGHRVMNHESKCRTLHGHRYKVEIKAEAEQLDDLGRVVDFGVIKGKVGKWLDDRWDHTMILRIDDPLLEAIQGDQEAYRRPYVTTWNPTAENMADFLLGKANDLLKQDGLRVVEVVVWETPNCYATAKAER